MTYRESLLPALDDVPVTVAAADLGRVWPSGAATAWLHSEKKAFVLRMADEIQRFGRLPSDLEVEAWLTSPAMTCRVALTQGATTTEAAPIDLLSLGHDDAVLHAFSQRLGLAATYRDDHLERRRRVFQNLIVLLVDGMVKAPGPPALATFSETLKTELQIVAQIREQLLEQCDTYQQKLTTALASNAEPDSGRLAVDAQ